MRLDFRVTLYLLVLWSLLLSKAWAATPIEDCFRVDFNSIHYNESLTISNPRRSSRSRTNRTSESLALVAYVKVTDPNRLLAFCNRPTVTLVTDPQGGSITPVPARSPGRLSYGYLQFQWNSVMPAPLPKWRQVLQSVLRFRSPPPRRHYVLELSTPTLSIDLETTLLEPGATEIGRLEGHFYALTADSVEYVDVPFEPNTTWVRLTPTQEIRVVDAQSVGSTYSFIVETRPQGPANVDLDPGQPLPERLALSYMLIDRAGRPRPYLMPKGSLGVSSSGSGKSMETIRYVIAVNPKHSKIPFVFEHIPLPQP